MSRSTALSWYPFRSPQVRDIYEHLTADEYVALSRNVGKVGASFGILFPVLGFLSVIALQRVFLPPWPAWAIPWAIPATVAGTWGALLILGFAINSFIRHKTKRMLCETEYARQMGFTPETLPLYDFRFRLSTLLLWGVPYAAVVSWIAAWDGPLPPPADGNPAPNQLIKMIWLLLATVLFVGLYALTRRRAKRLRDANSPAAEPKL